MLRAKATRFKKEGASKRDRLLSSTDAVGRFAGIPIVVQAVNASNRSKMSRKVLEKALGDLERDSEDKTSAVHFLRFELEPAEIGALKDGAELAAGIDHENYRVEVRPIPDTVRKSLLGDLD